MLLHSLYLLQPLGISVFDILKRFMVGRLKAGCGAALTISIKMGFLRYTQKFEIKLSKKRKILYVCANGGAVPAGAAWSHDQIPSDFSVVN
jgi:hypothetical protein